MMTECKVVFACAEYDKTSGSLKYRMIDGRMSQIWIYGEKQAGFGRKHTDGTTVEGLFFALIDRLLTEGARPYLVQNLSVFGGVKQREVSRQQCARQLVRVFFQKCLEGKALGLLLARGRMRHKCMEQVILGKPSMQSLAERLSACLECARLAGGEDRFRNGGQLFLIHLPNSGADFAGRLSLGRWHMIREQLIEKNCDGSLIRHGLGGLMEQRQNTIDRFGVFEWLGDGIEYTPIT